MQRKLKKNLIDSHQWLMQKAATQNSRAALLQTSVCGYTVCAPRGATLSQQDIEKALVDILSLQLPITLYQLPQITQNEMSATLVADLAKRFNNFIMFKDTSGQDKVALSAENMQGVLLLRGAEGDYSHWYNKPYYGLLLSSANAFGKELNQLLAYLQHQKTEQAQELSVRITHVVNSAFNTVAKLPAGNPFTNANKALDHFFAYGPTALKAPSPRLHSGDYLPQDILQSIEKLLIDSSLMPTKGYL